MDFIFSYEISFANARKTNYLKDSRNGLLLVEKSRSFINCLKKIMKLNFNKNYFIAFLILFFIEAAIAIFFIEGFIRHTLGDYLAVIMLYCFFKSFIKGMTLPLAIITLAGSFIVEFLQRTDFLKILGLERSQWANLVFGNFFSVQDLVAYTLGIVTVLILEKLITHN